MKITSEQLAAYRKDIEESDLAPHIKQQALIGIVAIEENDGNLEAAAESIMSDLSDTQRNETLKVEAQPCNPEVRSIKSVQQL